jgi:hypothetical protein
MSLNETQNVSKIQTRSLFVIVFASFQKPNNALNF